ncbi:SPOR domain-containing protein [Nocardiopsis ganjiahuensis]|uniref:SPOR domain-containing protein n=1 Tax=Nocardiopsis ganjiahuensis TaxID=239984 RepID=UPI00034B31D0|nr:hypothetical protein [Nocardiopsis ganjiahuensis]
MPKPAVIAAVALLFLATGCGLPAVRETVPGADEQRTTEPADQEPPVPGAEEPVSSPEPTAGTGTAEPEPGETEDPREPEATGGTGEPETEGESEEEVPDEAAEYMAALAAGDDPERMREGLSLAAEDSTAHTYLRHFVQVFSAWDAAGDTYRSSTLTPVDGGFELCRPEPEAPTCTEFTRFTTEDGLITGFLVDGADPGKRLVSGHGVAASSEGVDVHLLTAYQSVTDDVLVVTAEFTTVDNVDLDLFGAAYTAPDGREYRAEEAVGEYDLDAGATTQTALFFPDAEVGGDLAVTGCLDECFAVIDLEFPVK